MWSLMHVGARVLTRCDNVELPLQGFRTKQDGLVNAGDILKTRVDNPKDVLKRDQEVWVKVISLAGGRLRLSMRDVDQKTGRDLIPMGKPGTGERLRIYAGGAKVLCVWLPHGLGLPIGQPKGHCLSCEA